MKKIIILLVAIVTCFTALFTGCGDSTGFNNKLTISASDAVSSNGGFAVVKGDYVYFINGVETYTADNKYGDVVNGALVRVKKSDLANPATATAEVVIPSLFVASDYTSGFYMFTGDSNVYYASPVTAKNKEGVVENSKLDFIKTSLDGKTSVTLKTVDDNTTQYRYVQGADNKVYLVLKTVNEDAETVIEIINATDNKLVKTTDKIESVIFTDGGAGTEIYYTVVPHNETLDQDEAYNEIHRVKVDGTSELVLSGKGLYGTQEDENPEGFGVSGVKFTLIKDTADTLYFSGAYVDTSIASVTRYYALNKASKDYEVINEGTSTASKVFAANSYYVSKNAIVYLDATYGLVKYDYNTVGSTDVSISEGRVQLFYDKDLVGYTVKFWQDGYLYVTDSSNYYYRVNVAALLDDDATNDNVAVETVNFLANSTSWYAPEVIDGYFLSVYTSDPYNGLVFVSDIAKNAAIGAAEDAEDQIAAIREVTKEQVNKNLETSISLQSDAVKEKIANYMEETFKEE